MSEPVSLSPAWLLHVRKYRDTSVILEMLTQREGRVAAVMRGVRSPRSRVAGHVRPFAPVLVAWMGRGELKTVRTMDFPSCGLSLSGDELMLGLYVNELLVRLLGKHDPAPEIFEAYGELLAELDGGDGVLPALRRFELLLLMNLGYGITFDIEADSGDPVEPGVMYRYLPNAGFVRADRVTDDMNGTIAEVRPAYGEYKGEHLLSICRGELAFTEVDRCVKRVVRASIGVLLGGRELKSRELFRRLGELT